MPRSGHWPSRIRQYDCMCRLFATGQPDLEKRLGDGDHDGATISSFAISAARPWPRTATGSSSTWPRPLKSPKPEVPKAG